MMQSARERFNRDLNLLLGRYFAELAPLTHPTIRLEAVLEGCLGGSEELMDQLDAVQEDAWLAIQTAVQDNTPAEGG